MATPPDEEAPEGKDGEESKKVSEEFDEVCFLTVHAEYFAEFFRTKHKKYIVPQVIMVRDFSSPSVNSSVPATLTNKVDLADFVYADPKLFASLYPKIEFYRVDYDQDGNIRERLFLFPGEATNQLNYNTLRKLPGIGITGVNFTLAGSNPAAAEKLIDFEMDIDLASAYEFAPYELDNILTKYKNKKAFPFDETDTDNTTTNFLSLLLHPQGKRNEYDGKFYRIKAKVGWQPVDSSYLLDMGYSSDVADRLSKALSKQYMTLMLNLISHNIEITEEGSISLNIKYQASLEQSTDSGVFDLFYRLSLARESYASPDSKISQLKKQQQKTLKAIDNACIGLPESTKKLIREKRQEELNKEIENTQEEQSTYLKELEIELKNKLMQYMLDRESKTVWEITKGAFDKDDQASLDENDYSSYSIQISNKDVENYQNYIKDLNSGNTDLKINPPQFVTTLNESSLDDDIDLLQTTYDIKAQDGTVLSKVNKFGSDTLLSFDEGVVKTFDWVQSASPDYHSTISFVYLYDLICVFYNVLRQNIETHYSGQDDSTKQKRENAIRELREIKIILGDYQDPDTGKTVNIGEIPVHLATFNDWYLNNIGKADRTNYTLRDFVFSIVNDIVAKSLGAACITGANIEKKISIGFSTYSLEHNVGLEPARQAATATDEQRTDATGATKNSRPNCYMDVGDRRSKEEYRYCLVIDENKPKKNTNYLYIYAKQLPCELDGKDIIKDIENGVYHFFIGQAQGINKSIKFKRIDQPYLKEARATKEDSFVLGQLREVYNLDITMVGNTIFHPGMVIYVHPPIELGVTTDENSFSNLLGIGGYYSVIKVQSSIKIDTFETTLECVYLSAGICDQGKCKPDSELTDIERKELQVAKLEVAKALLETVALTQDSVKKAIYDRDNSKVLEQRKVLNESVKIYNDYITSDSFQTSNLNGIEFATISIETEEVTAFGPAEEASTVTIQKELSDEEVIKLQQTLSSISGSVAAREQEVRNLVSGGA